MSCSLLDIHKYYTDINEGCLAMFYRTSVQDLGGSISRNGILKIQNCVFYTTGADFEPQPPPPQFLNGSNDHLVRFTCGARSVF